MSALRKPEKFATHFWSRIKIGSKSQCWPFQGYRDQNGYGVLRRAGKLWYAHRVSYDLVKGAIGEKFVLHKCDNPACCNPEHLFLGTQIENIADRDSKGRQRTIVGQDHYNSRLTTDDVLAIRASSATIYALAEKYKIHFTTVSDIRRRKSWRHLA